MTVRKSGSKFFPVKKNGTLWKTGFSSKAKAEAAIRQNKARLSKFTGGKGRGGGGKKKSTTANNPSPASTSHNSKKLTHGKFHDALSIGGPGARRLLLFAEDKDPQALFNGVVADQSGFDMSTGEFSFDNLKRGYTGAVTRKVEKLAFKAIGIKGPRSKIKNKGDVMDWLTYEGAAVFDAMQGRDPRDKFQRYYETHYGHNLQTNENEFFRTVTRKWAPYIAQKMARRFIGF